MFKVQEMKPHPLLMDWVDAYLFLSVEGMEGGCIEHSILPHVFQNLIIDFGEPDRLYDLAGERFCPPHFVVGPSTQLRRIRLFHGMKKILIRLKPGAIFRLFGVPVNPFIDRITDATSTLCPAIADLGVSLRKASLRRKVAQLDLFFLSQLSRADLPGADIREALGLVTRRKGNISLSQLAECTYTGKRTLERHFREQTGLYPKIFCRLVRLNETVKYAEDHLAVKWTQLADAFGYYDQSHFIHEFRALAGCAPQHFFSSRTELEKILSA